MVDDGAVKWVRRAVAVVVVLAAVTSGCAVKVGDSNLVDDWAPMVDAKLYVPPSDAGNKAPPT
jgi:hypothetical protein